MDVEFLSQAEKELDDGINYYEALTPNLGNDFLHEVHLAIERIRLYPNAWQQISNRTRRCLIKRFPYGVIYQIRKDVILIIAVAHLHRKPGYWNKRSL